MCGDYFFCMTKALFLNIVQQKWHHQVHHLNHITYLFIKFNTRYLIHSVYIYYTILFSFACRLVLQEIILINQPAGVTCLTTFPVLLLCCENAATFVFISIGKYSPQLPIYGNRISLIIFLSVISPMLQLKIKLFCIPYFYFIDWRCC